jgi:outer membrane protein assembly factor BamB
MLPLWKFQLDDRMQSSPVSGAGRVFVRSERGTLYALSSTGEEYWRADVPTAGGDLSPAVAGGLVVAGGRTGLSAFVAETGYLVWRGETGPTVSSPLLCGSQAYVGSTDGFVSRVDLRDGTVIWSAGLGSPISSNAAASESRIFIGTDDRELCELSQTDGAISKRLALDWQVNATAVIADGHLFISSWSDMCCIRLSDFSESWRFETDSEVYGSPSVGGGRVCFGSLDHKIYCLNQASGQLVWRFETGDFVYCSPTVINDLILVGSYDGNLYCLQATTGEARWHCEIGAGASSPAVAAGRVYIGSYDGSLYCFPWPFDGPDVWPIVGGCPQRRGYWDGRLLR